MKYIRLFESKIPPKFKKGDRCMYIYPVGKGIMGVLDDNMVIESEDPFWMGDDWWYDIVGKVNPSAEKV